MKPLLILTTLISLIASAHAAAIITTGQTVGGTTTNIALTTTTPTTNDSDLTLTKAAGSLTMNVKTTTVNTDWWISFTGLSIDTNTFKYVQVDFSSVTVGAVSAAWQAFFVDGDSTIGGASNSGHGIGTGVVGTVPFSVVIDMTAFTGASGGTEGVTGWGAAGAGSDIVTDFRLDMFEGTATNKGKSFTISGITLGSQLIPEPSAALLGALGLLALLRRRRA